MTSSFRLGRQPFALRNSSKKRRPTGMSRRRKKQLGFEPLEDRRVMSANSVAAIESYIYDNLTSYSSNSLEGAQQILLNELARYADQSNVNQVEYETYSVPTDPLVADQWHLINTGQQVGNPDFQVIFGTPGEDINVAPAWALGYTGEGVKVAVLDSGVQLLHPDLVNNIDPNLQFDAIDFDGDANPTIIPNPFLADSAHGTAVAGIIASEANNGLGGTGIAPNAQIVPIRLIDAGVTELGFIEAFRYETDQIDITNNSWGPAVDRGLAGPTIFGTLALRDSIFFGRPDENGDPLGIIHVFSSGNSALLNGTSSYNGWVNSRYTIGVSGIDHDGQYNNVDGTTTGYPEASASVLVAAPTGSNTLDIADDGFPGLIGSGIYTADITGDAGFNGPDNTGLPFGDRDFLEDTDYTSTFNGTSASAPMVSGVIALMLEANPNLHWRDVQEILVRAARPTSFLDTHADGADKATGIDYQSTWIMNQVPLFHDPDLWDPLIPNELQILNPTLDLNASFGASAIHYVPTPQGFTNGAGYTVSQGRGTNTEATGFAHGVIDAELAVLLAEQWHERDQNLPDELTFTTEFNGSLNLPGAEVINDVSGVLDLIVPGGLGGLPGFGAYWSEYYAANPDFTQGFNARGIPLELTVPSPNDMTIETVEVRLNITGDMTEFLDNVRVVLVSPNGTQSELNHYFVDPSFDDADNIHQAGPFSNLQSLLGLNGSDAVTTNENWIDPLTTVDTGINDFVFSTNRHWGERSDDAIIFDAVTNEPVIDTFGLGGNEFNAIEPSAGDLHTSGWKLYMENYSPADLDLTAFEIVWHGSPINANTERVQGFVGIDENQDDLFNYSRMIQQISEFDPNPTLRLGEVENLIDPNQEALAPNVTVFAHRDVNSNGVLDNSDILVDQFVTGHDGNYYFDLVPDDYIISLDPDSLGGFSTLDDSLTPGGFLQDYQTEWAITTDFFRVWEYEQVGTNPLTGAPINEVPVDNGTPDPFLDGTGSPVAYGMQNINFLLDPGAPAAPQVDFSGTIFADTNGDGVFNDDDVAVAGVGVFGDVNRNGALDAGEILTTTDANGDYSLTIPLTEDITTVWNIGVRPPTNWTATNPTSGIQSFLVQQGLVQDNVDFYVMPPTGVTAGDGSALSGVVIGTVYNDPNEDGIRQASEVGVPNLTVYVDTNSSGSIDAGDIVTTTNSNGAYAFATLPSGNHVVRLDFAPDSGISQTFPDFNLPQLATINAGGTHAGVNFGVTSGGGGGGGGILDFGDLPDVYGTRMEDDGPRHPQGLFFLGASIDSETNGVPSVDALGDDTAFIDDEDGITLVGGVLEAGTTGTIEAIASRHGGFLQGWIDFDDSGSFEPSEKIFDDELLDAGFNSLEFSIPASLGDTQLYARFRFGEFGLGQLGAALIGEVEDYAFTVFVEEVAPLVANPDFDGDGMIGGFDFLNWQLNAGMTSSASVAQGDANYDGRVDIVDLAHWEIDYGGNQGSTIAAASAIQAPAGTGDFDLDGRVDGLDLLTWQLNAGTAIGASLSDGDGNFDGSVGTADLAAWEHNYGTNSTPSGTGTAAATVLGANSEGVLAASTTTSDGTIANTASDVQGPASFLTDRSAASSALSTVRFDSLFSGLHRMDRDERTDSVVSRDSRSYVSGNDGRVSLEYYRDRLVRRESS